MQQPRAGIVTAIVLALCLAALPGTVAAQDTVTYAFAHRIYQHFADGSSINVNGVDAIEVPTGRLAARLDLPDQLGYKTQPFLSPDQRWLYITGADGVGRIDTRALAFAWFPVAGATDIQKGFASPDGRLLYLVEPTRILHVDADTFEIVRAVSLPANAFVQSTFWFVPRGANIQMNASRTQLYFMGISGDWYYNLWVAGVDVETGALLGQTPSVRTVSAAWITSFEPVPDESAAWLQVLADPTRWVDLQSFQWIPAGRPELPWVTGVAWLDGTRAFLGYTGYSSTNACGIFDTTTGVKLRNLPCNALSGEIRGSFTRDGQYLAMLNAAHPRSWQPVMFFDTATWTSRWSDTYWFDSSYDGWILTATVALDSTPPVIVPTVDGRLAPNGTYTSDVTVTWQVTDPESAVTSRTGCDTARVTADTTGTTFTCTATSSGGTASRSVTIARDATPPVIGTVRVTPDTLWPPNHQMVTVTAAVSATDAAGATPSCRMANVASSEPANGLGDGDTAPDWTSPTGLLVALRAERAGNGPGRTYTLTIACADASGNVATALATVGVPKSQAKR